MNKLSAMQRANAWEQRKLGDLGSVAMCKRIFKEQTTESGDVPFFKIGTFGDEPDAFITRELFEEYRAKYPYPAIGNILISASGSIGRTVEYAGKDEYFQDSNIVWLKHDERLDNGFLKHFYSVVKWVGIEGSTIKRLYNENILGTTILLPSLVEQRRIGEFFDAIGTLITLHQRELEKLQGMKKLYLRRYLCRKRHKEMNSFETLSRQ
jgi:type I restriction enzyme S subunit